MTSFLTPTRFHFLNKKIISVHISPKVPNIAECANIAEFFRQKSFGDIEPPVFYIQGSNRSKRQISNNISPYLIRPLPEIPK